MRRRVDHSADRPDIAEPPPSVSVAPATTGAAEVTGDVVMTVDQLQADPHNRRRHDERNIGMVADALRQVGAARSIVVDEADLILAGNGVVEAAKQAGITRIRIIEADGTEVIAVRRRGLTDEQKRALAMFDNRTAELSEWNYDQLRADRAAGLDLQPFWTDGEQAMMFGQAVDPTWKGMPSFDHEDTTAYRTIRVHFANQEDLDAFAKLIGQTVTEETKYLWFPPAETDPHIAHQFVSPDADKQT